MRALADVLPEDVSVVIPTRDRWPVLGRTIAALREQTVDGFEIVVAVDGDDQTVPTLDPSIVVVVRAIGGPGAARNTGAAAASGRLLVFLDDDVVPSECLVEAHLSAHGRAASATTVVTGRVRWHPEVASEPVASWLERCGLPPTSPTAVDGEAPGRQFRAANASVHRGLFDDAGGFDERIVHYGSDTDLGLRLVRSGASIVHEPSAEGHLLRSYTWAEVRSRAERMAMGERQVAALHPDVSPGHLAEMVAMAQPPAGGRLWLSAARRLPSPGRIHAAAARHADRWRRADMARAFVRTWERSDALADLHAYLGDDFDGHCLIRHHEVVDAEEHASGDEETFYRTSRMYLYDLTVFSLSGTKDPYHAVVRRLVPPGSRLLDYGCGIGADGLALAATGHRVEFADFDNPSTTYLQWRLERRGLDAAVHDLDGDVPGGFDLAYSFDVIEHVDDPWAFLSELEDRSGIVVVNLLEPDPEDEHLHRPLPIPEIVRHASRRGLLHYSRHGGGRSHLVAYRASGSGPTGAERMRGLVAAARFGRTSMSGGKMGS